MMENDGELKEYNFYIIRFEEDKRIMLEIRKSDDNPNEYLRLTFNDLNSFSEFVDGIADGRDKIRDEITKIINDPSRINSSLK